MTTTRTEPQVLQVQFEENGDLQIHWTRPQEQTDLGATFHTTLITREGLESNEDLNYYANELRGDAHEVLMAWLKVQNRADKV